MFTFPIEFLQLKAGRKGDRRTDRGNVSDYLLITRVNEVCGAC